jgi:hypothetical protein
MFWNQLTDPKPKTTVSKNPLVHLQSNTKNIMLQELSNSRQQLQDDTGSTCFFESCLWGQGVTNCVPIKAGLPLKKWWHPQAGLESSAAPSDWVWSLRALWVRWLCHSTGAEAGSSRVHVLQSMAFQNPVLLEFSKLKHCHAQKNTHYHTHVIYDKHGSSPVRNSYQTFCLQAPALS